MKRILLVCLLSFIILFATTPALASPFNNGSQQLAITDMLDTVSNEKITLEPLQAAEAYLELLTADQQKRSLLELKPDTLVEWSNLPATSENRNGISLGELSPESLKAGLRLVRSILSPEGFQQASEIIKADTFLKTSSAHPPFKWGADLYFLSIHGQPSLQEPWFVQFSGHHLAETIGFNTDEVAVTPQFTGLEPRGFHWNNQPYAPFENRIATVEALFQSLDEEQLTQAELKQTFNDVVVGPGKDGDFPIQEGIAYDTLTNRQQAHVKKLILSWVESVPKPQQKNLSDVYFTKDALAHTTIAWSVSPEITTAGAYVRLDGPRLWLELSSREGAAKKDDFHLHTVWRDKLADYGSWIPKNE